MEAIANFFVSTGFYQFFQGDNWKCAIMLLIAVVLLFLGIVKKFEPLLLVPIAFGMLLTNLPGANMFHEILFAGGHVHWDLFGGEPITAQFLSEMLSSGVSADVLQPYADAVMTSAQNLFSADVINDLMAQVAANGSDAVGTLANQLTALASAEQYAANYGVILSDVTVSVGLIDVLYLGISGGISGTCWSAELMAEELRGEYPDRMIRVLNTCGASLGEGLVVLEAAKMLEKGCTADEIIRQAEENCGRMRQFFMVDDLKYLRRGGRISAAAQVAGSLLKIKPILQSDPEGHIIQHSKVRGQLKAMETLAELYKEYAVDGTRTVGIAHADCPDGALRLQAKLRDAGQTGEILSVCYEPVTGAHVGPGTVALFFYSEEWR